MGSENKEYKRYVTCWYCKRDFEATGYENDERIVIDDTCKLCGKAHFKVTINKTVIGKTTS